MFRLSSSREFLVSVCFGAALAAGCSGGSGGPTCFVDNGGCDPNASCQNIGTGPSCTCNEGYTGNGLTCVSLSGDTDAGNDGGTDEGDGGTDGGDGGIVRRVGETATLVVDAGPNSVLSAVATFSWAGPNELTIVSVTYSSGDTSSTTPTTTVNAVAAGDGGSSIQLPVVGLEPGTTYTFQATAFQNGQDASNAPLASSSVTFTTPALPAGPETFTASDAGTTTGPTLIARVGGTSPDYLTINDPSGVPIWYYELPQPGLAVADFQQQPDGTLTIAVGDMLADGGPIIPGLGQTPATYQQIDVLGNFVHNWMAIDVPEGWTNFDGGTGAEPDAGTSEDAGEGVDGGSTDGGTDADAGSPDSGSPSDAGVDAGPSMPAAAVSILATDSHDIRLQSNGDALLFGFAQQELNLSAYHGAPNATVVAEVLERVTSSGALVFAWNAFDYVSVGNVDCPLVSLAAQTVDFTHANSIDVSADSNYLISLRNLSQVVKIDSTTGDIVWKLGGKDNQFTFLGDTLMGFSCQHGARELPNGDLLVFDDRQEGSRVVEYSIDPIGLTATMVWSYSPTTVNGQTPTVSYAQRITSGERAGNTVVTLETTSTIQEVDPAGTVVWQLSDPSMGELYRAYRLDSLYKPLSEVVNPP